MFIQGLVIYVFCIILPSPIETFERLCMLLPTLTLLHFYKIPDILFL